MAKFLVNKSTAVVILKDSKIVIPISGHASITDSDVEHQDILDAVNRGWVEIREETPAVAEPFKPQIEFENAKPQGSLTIPGKEPVEPKVETPVETPAEVKEPVEGETPTPKRGKKHAVTQ